MRDTAGEARMKSSVTIFNGPLHMDVPVLDDQEKNTYNGSVWTQDVE